MKINLRSALVAVTAIFGLATSAQEADVTVAIDADFTIFTEGSPEEPVAFASYGTGSFTSYFPSWSVSKVYQAGGALLIADGGYARTASTNLSANGGTVKITAELRAADSYGGGVKFQVGYSSSNSQTTYVYDDQWHTVTAIVGGGSSYGYVRIDPYLSANGIIIRNLKVEQSAAFIAAPVAYQPSSATTTSFTASWSRVTGATGYLLDVYRYENGEKVYSLRDEIVTSTTKSVSGLEDGYTYFYTVRSTNGTGISDYSNEIEVVEVISSIDTPANVAIQKTDNTFTATWDAVAKAIGYQVNVVKHATLGQDTDVTMLHDDFSAVTVGSFEQIEYIYRTDPYTNRSGWDGSALGAAQGTLVLSPYGSSSYLSTPELNLSDNGGAFKATYTMAEGAFGTFYSGATATLSLIDSEGNELESQEITFAQGFSAYEVNFTKGTAACRVRLTYSGDRKVFIDEVTITQLKAAGSVIDTPYKSESVETTSYTCQCELEDGVTYGFTVAAVGRTVASSEITEITSDPTEEVIIDFGKSGIGTTAAFTASITADGDIITVNTATAAIINVYNAAGRLIYTANAPQGSSAHAIGHKGLAIVSVNGATAKLMLR